VTHGNLRPQASAQTEEREIDMRARAGLLRLSLFGLALTLAIPASAAADEGAFRKDVQMVAPALDKYTQDRLLGDVWKRPGLSRRDRSVVTLAALMGRNQTIALSDRLNSNLFLQHRNRASTGEVVALRS
jgi:alkylhydroperoxidase/carboxymuconolactone decarboxylase family protein YurZ